MARIVVTIISELFDSAEQEASIRENLQVKFLIEETLKEFNLPEDSLYALRIESTGKALDSERTLEQQNVRTGERIAFTRERRAPRREAVVAGNASRVMLVGSRRHFLREDTTGRIYDITFQPSIIGRPDHTNPAANDLLAVNLEGLEGAKSVSRYHARLTEEDGKLFIESLADHNPAYLNGTMVRVGDKRVLIAGDKIRVGQISLTFGSRSGGTVVDARQGTMSGTAPQN